MSEPEPGSPKAEAPEASAQRLRAVAELFGTARLSVSGTGALTDDPFAGLEALTPHARDGEQIGPYRLERLLGRGGMGAVYAAQRVDGEFEQTVALKLLRRDRVGPEALARFQRERAILARLQHPHIARLLDGGISATGELWFALELVAGRAIIDYANDQNLELRQRLTLFGEVCEAVGYAHRNLVVHRDLKPSNILVDADGHAKLLDFGIAKLLDAEAEQASQPLTLADQRVLTPDYAAPEQILGQPITTATDIYALGLLLFELLTGRRAQHLQAVSWAEAMERAATTDPPAPSRVVSTDGVRGIDAAALRGDLDAIVLKALRREPERRYTAVAELSDDLQRHLAGYPVRARGDARSYRVGRFLRRHRVGVAAVTAIVLALASGLGVALWQARVARLEAERSNEVRSFVLGLFRGIDPEQARGQEVSARELLDAGAARVQQELPRQPEVQIELLSTLGNLYMRLGQAKSAEPLLDRALALSRVHYASDGPALAAALIDLALARLADGRHADAGALLDEADRLLIGAASQFDALRSRALTAHVRLAVRSDDLIAAERYSRALLALEASRVGLHHPDYGVALSALGWTLMWRDQWAEAERLARAALEIPGRNSLGALELGDQDLTLITTVLLLRGRYREALNYAEQNVENQRRRIGDDHIATRGARLTRAILWAQTGRLNDADAEAHAVMQVSVPGELRTRTDSISEWNMGRMLVARGKLSEGRDLLRRGYEGMRTRYGNDAKTALLGERDLGAVLVEMGDANAAESLLEHAADHFRRRSEGQGMQYAVVQVRLSELRHAQHREVEAEALARTALGTLNDTLGAEHDETGHAHHALGVALFARGDNGGAATEFKAALDNYERLFGPEDTRVVEYRYDWSRAREENRESAAESIVRAAAETLARDGLNETPTRVAARSWLAAHADKRGRAVSSIGAHVVVKGVDGTAKRRHHVIEQRQVAAHGSSRPARIIRRSP